MKKSTQIALLSCLLLAILIAAFGLTINKASTPTALPGKAAAAVKEPDESLTKLLLDKRIEQIVKWTVGEAGDEPLLCIVKSFDENPNYEGSGQKLTVYDRAGATLYEDYFTSVEGLSLSSALRVDVSQLLVEVNYGGNTTSFLHMLDYRHGKVVKVEIEGDGEYNSSEPQVRPQFRHSVAPSKEPFQIMLTEGVGLASPSEKHTYVHRYKDGAYRYIGKYNQHEVDDYIEKLMAQGKVKPRR